MNVTFVGYRLCVQTSSDTKTDLNQTFKWNRSISRASHHRVLESESGEGSSGTLKFRTGMPTAWETRRGVGVHCFLQHHGNSLVRMWTVLQEVHTNLMCCCISCRMCSTCSSCSCEKYIQSLFAVNMSASCRLQVLVMYAGRENFSETTFSICPLADLA